MESSLLQDRFALQPTTCWCTKMWERSSPSSWSRSSRRSTSEFDRERGKERKRETEEEGEREREREREGEWEIVRSKRLMHKPIMGHTHTQANTHKYSPS